MKFKETVENLRLEIDNDLAQECLTEMLNGRIFYNSGFEQEKERLTSLYKLRFRIAQDRENLSKSEDLIS